MKAVVAERGQVTIPKLLRQRLGIRPGTVLDFEVQDTLLIAIKVSLSDPLEQVYGCLKLDRSTDEIIRDLRGDA